ncbi:division/outer membrane stress-associated lipid-binding lipoprotein [Morganella sp. GD04133]|uniref:division/outer membrane stress-associated lipid-binding lipoprotein n=1 Tax=Morganella TaxID=581 RepID=UPI00244B2483|nr:division/outer membrane stress-associated lipid-binding lipoprotein [Morganella sp. GD04133]MDH0354310.1 division/outer membrane stress-associated lipid-binding lipoprotein [Morganella sp. GD04133]
MRIVPVAALICSALLLQGCIGAALVGSAAVATKAATDPRSVGTQVDDGTLEARVSGQLNKDKDIKQQRIIPVAYQGKVLLIGQANDLSLARRAKEIAAKVDGTELVYNEVRQGEPIDLGTASKDAWITTKVRSKLLTSDAVKSANIKVITENGEIFLLGVVTRQEGAAAAKVASETDGAKKVTTAFTWLN